MKYLKNKNNYDFYSGHQTLILRLKVLICCKDNIWIKNRNQTHQRRHFLPTASSRNKRWLGKRRGGAKDSSLQVKPLFSKWKAFPRQASTATTGTTKSDATVHTTLTTIPEERAGGKEQLRSREGERARQWMFEGKVILHKHIDEENTFTFTQNIDN